MTRETPTVRMFAGIPAHNLALYHQIRFHAGDPAALLEFDGDGRRERLLIIRSIEVERARRQARADRVAAPQDYAPAGGLAGDHELSTAQAVAECLRRSGARRVVADRTLPFIFAHYVREAGIAIDCDPNMGVRERRAKDAGEVAAIREAQGVTEEIMRIACETVARATVGAGGVLMADGQPLSAERVRAMIDVWLLERGYVNPACIVAPGRCGGDCHERGSGPIRTHEPVIIDIFPCNRQTHYCGDCTRTVVHGEAPEAVRRMHAAVAAAKREAMTAIRAGVRGHDVNEATRRVIRSHGYDVSLPPEGAPETYCAMTHGTGHGVGLDVHEPPLLAENGDALIVGDVVTVEPGLYCKAVGGVRIEDVVAVTADGCENLNRLPEGLDWR
ncbi:MAG: hypothetical protein CHACPFDD_02706 [Phycisphaerae bacterium]|nr:hypothetical protein [Phycisphaerae bacterium]